MLGVFRGPAGVEERPLAGGQRARVPHCPFLGTREPDPAIQRIPIALQHLPCAGGLGEFAVQAAPFAVFVQPVPQSRPRRDQRLVRNLHAVLVQGDQPRRH